MNSCRELRTINDTTQVADIAFVQLIPEDATVEMEAKKAAGYFTNTKIKDDEGLKATKGRALF